MSQCIQCLTVYHELNDEQGDHACPNCGLMPEQIDEREKRDAVYWQGPCEQENQA